MAMEHRFDRLHRTLTEDAPRRRLLRAAGALAAGLVLSGTPRPGMAMRNKGKGKGKKKGKGKGTKKPQPSCSGGACAAQPEWAGNQGQIDYCEFICDQCKAPPVREFCISGRDSLKIAVCCGEGATCCGDHCCLEVAGRKCCPPQGCVETNVNRRHCGDCFIQCLGDETCRDGECRACSGTVCDNACVDMNLDRRHCGSCFNACASGEACVGGECVVSLCGPTLTLCPPSGCVDTKTNSAHCGRCDNACLTGHLRYCVNGQCGCNPASDTVPCNTSCIPRGYKCCEGFGGYGCSNPNAVCRDDGGCGAP